MFMSKKRKKKQNGVESKWQYEWFISNKFLSIEMVNYAITKKKEQNLNSFFKKFFFIFKKKKNDTFQKSPLMKLLPIN